MGPKSFNIQTNPEFAFYRVNQRLLFMFYYFLRMDDILHTHWFHWQGNVIYRIFKSRVSCSRFLLICLTCVFCMHWLLHQCWCQSSLCNTYNIMWCDMIYDMVWYDIIWCDVMWCDVMSYDIWYGMIWYYMVWCVVMWCDVTGRDVIWYIRYMIWYITMSLTKALSTPNGWLNTKYT